jgi:hypothetical protein
MRNVDPAEEGSNIDNRGLARGAVVVIGSAIKSKKLPAVVSTKIEKKREIIIQAHSKRSEPIGGNCPVRKPKEWKRKTK